jgi:hypothetical protein
MNSRGRDGLVARIRQMGRSLPDVPEPARPAGADLGPTPMAALETRVADLEKLVQGLQDSVYREAQRQERRVTELEAATDPATLAVALSKSARERGL